MRALIRCLLAAVLGLAFASPADAMTFRKLSTAGFCDDCFWVSAAGPITPETPREFARFDAGLHRDFERFDYPLYRKFGRFDDILTIWLHYTVIFDSSGGDVAAGIRLGQMIRARKLDTAIGTVPPGRALLEEPRSGTCVSACAFAFLAGVKRGVNTSAIGVRPFVGAAAGRTLAAAIDFVSSMGVDPGVVGVAASTPPGGTHYFSQAEQQTLRIDWNPRRFGPWVLEPSGNRIVARTTTPDGSESATLFCAQDRVPRLLIVSPRLRDGIALNKAIYTLLDVHGYRAMGKDWSVKEAETRRYEGQPALELKLPGFDPDALDETTDIAVRAPEPRDTAYFLFDYPLSTDRARDSFRVALSNCV